MTTKQAQPQSTAGRPRRGQSMVELALTMPLLALLLIGAADLGRVFIYYSRLTNSVEAGALAGRFSPQVASNTTDCSNANNSGYVNCRVVLESKGMLTLSDVEVTCPGSTGSSCTSVSVGGLLVVKATYKFQPLTSQLAGILGANYKMSKTIKMVITG